MHSHSNYQVDSIQQVRRQAMETADQGDTQSALQLYEQALSINSSDIISLNNYALLLGQLGHSTKAHKIFNSLTTLAPNLPEGHYNHGNLFMTEGNVQRAANCFELAVNLRADYAEAWYSLGVCYRRRGLLDEAVNAFKKGTMSGEDPENIFQLGVTLHIAGRLKEAEAAYGTALSIVEQPLYLYNMGVLLQEQKRFIEARDYLEKVVALQPDNAKAYNNLGLTLDGTGCYREAEDCFLKAVFLQPDLAEAYNNLGHMLMTRRESFAEAEANFKQAIKINPEFCRAWYNLATCRQGQNLIPEALSAFQRAIDIEPDLVEAHWNYSHALLVSGNFREGFNEYLWRWRRPQAVKPDVPLPPWRGEYLPEATVLIHTEQGAGDNIQFIRYLTIVGERVGKILLVCGRGLIELFQASGLAHAIVGQGDLTNVAKVAQCYCPLLDLPAILSTEQNTIPAPDGYLRAPDDLRVELAELINKTDKLRVGVVWQGNPKHRKDHQRSIPYQVFRKIFKAADIGFYSLSKDTPPDSADGIYDLAPHLKSFAHTAAAISHLDLVVTVDTSVAHLAGALGVKTWILLPYVPDWRWLLDREDTPWYSCARLFRQSEAGNWLEVLERVKNGLVRMAGSGRTL